MEVCLRPLVSRSFTNNNRLADNERKWRNRKIQSKTVRIVYKYLCMLVFVCVCVVYSYVLLFSINVRVKIHMQHDKLEVVFRIDERRYVAMFASGWPRKKFFICFFIYLCAYLWGWTKHHYCSSKKIKLWFVSVNGHSMTLNI